MSKPGPSIRKAKWIRTPGRAKNSYWLFCKSFYYGGLHPEVPCRILGHQRYELFVNGIFVGRGSGAQSPYLAYYDTYDIYSYLHKGNNNILVRVYFCHEHPQPYAYRIFQGKGGLLLQVNSEGECLCATENSWKVKRDEAYSTRSQRINAWTGYQEIYDAGTSLNLLKDRIGAGKKWRPVAVLKTPPVPWENIKPRPIPNLRKTIVYPHCVYTQSDVSCYEFQGQHIRNPNGVLRREDQPCRIDSRKNKNPQRLILDFGHVRTGHICIQTRSGKGILRLGIGESLNVSQTDTVYLAAGPVFYRGFSRRSFRFLVIEVFSESVYIDLGEIWLEQTEYPFDNRGAFLSSDPLLNRIWNTCGRTVQSCSHDYYEDCPTREQALWCGDAQIDGRISAYQFGDLRLLAESIRRLAAIAHPDGWVPSVGPGGVEEQSPESFLPDHSLTWIFCLYDYYRYTGDIAFLETMFPVACRFMNYMEKELDSNALLPDCNRDTWWCFVDWAENIDRRDVVAAIQMFLYKAARDMAALAGEMRDEEKARRYRSLSTRIKKSINTFFWNDSLGAYVDCTVGNEYAQSNSVSRQTNALAVAWRISPRKRSRLLYRNVLSADHIPAITTGYFKHYLLLALFRLGRTEQAVREIRNYWGGMLAWGATTFWETFDPRKIPPIPERNWSLCHGFSCAPGYLLSAELMGIRPAVAGWKEVSIAPKINRSLRQASVTVPTPHGDIFVQTHLENSIFDVSVRVPASVKARIRLPDTTRYKCRISKKVY